LLFWILATFLFAQNSILLVLITKNCYTRVNTVQYFKFALLSWVHTLIFARKIYYETILLNITVLYKLIWRLWNWTANFIQRLICLINLRFVRVVILDLVRIEKLAPMSVLLISRVYNRSLFRWVRILIKVINTFMKTRGR